MGTEVTPMQFGEEAVSGGEDAMYAWSTIKVPLSLTALRSATAQHNLGSDIDDLVERAITHSDNSAALALRTALGTPGQARQAITRVFRAAGDRTTQPIRISDPDETFGLTPWALRDAATFMSHFPCLPDSGRIVDLMGEVDGVQQWGLKILDLDTAVKGGWGPDPDGGEDVRQFGVITFADGTRTAVAMSTYSSGQTMDTGTALLDKVATWLLEHRAHLPRGRCQG
ncbi:MAG: hypothetical protein QM662_16625 [Gordonia sp. (in: high G+C Gram-positive bacteria)]